MLFDKEVGEIAKDAFAEEHDGIDNTVQQRLREAREDALAGGKTSRNGWIPAAGMALACGIAAVMIMVSPVNENPAAELETALLEDNVEFEMLEDLEFYYWMEDEIGNGEANPHAT